MFRSILVPIRGDGGDQTSLGTALAVAKLFGSHIEARHFCPQELTIPLSYNAGQIASGLQMAAAFQKQSEQAARRARHEYERFCTKANINQTNTPSGRSLVSAEWLESVGDEVDQIIGLARRHDLLVLRTDPEGRTGFSPEAAGKIIIHRGDPVILAARRSPPAIGQTVVIAWKDTPEAEHALVAALPLLYKAKKTFVISVAEDKGEKDLSADRVVNRLRWHGLKADVNHIVAKAGAPAASLIERVNALHADLLVMGAYGRSRMRELMLGSFTKRVLSGTRVPVLVCH